MEAETPSSQALGAQVAAATRALSEFSDSVVVIATLYDGEGTVAKYSHIGNVFAMESSVRAWLRQYEKGGENAGDKKDA